MYDDEMFECILKPNAENKQPTLVYKYFSDVAEEIQKEYFAGMHELRHPQDRRTLLGSSISAMQSWATGG